MNCVVCKREASFRFCSNACVLAWAKAHPRVECAVCHYDPETGRLGIHWTNRLCTDCRRSTENQDWVQARKETASEVIAQDDASTTQTLRAFREEQRQAVWRVMARVVELATKGERVPIGRHDARGRRRDRRYRIQRLSIPEIAKRVGRSPAWVKHVLREHARDSRGTFSN
jgi:hypothetical protein